MPDIPTGATAGAIAKVLKITERVVAGRKADGRLPVMPGGAVDLHALVRAGAAAMAHRRAGADTGMTEPERFDAGMRAAVGTTAHITAQRLAKAGSGAPVAGVIHAAMDEARELLGLPADAPE